MDDDWLPPSGSEEEQDMGCLPCEGDGEADVVLPDYGDVNFWTEVYTHQRGRELAPQERAILWSSDGVARSGDEWLLSYQHFCAQGWRRFFDAAVRASGPGPRILDLGCGVAFLMDIQAGILVEGVFLVDHLDGVVGSLEEDACDLTSTLEAKDFDVVFDKSTLDALKCRGPEATGRMSSEVHRILQDDGVYLCVSLNPPEDAQPGTLSVSDANEVLRHALPKGDSWTPAHEFLVSLAVRPILQARRLPLRQTAATLRSVIELQAFAHPFALDQAAKLLRRLWPRAGGPAPKRRPFWCLETVVDDLIRKHAADPHQVPPVSAGTLIHKAAYHSDHKQGLQIAQSLVEEHRVDALREDTYYQTPVFAAARVGNTELCGFLLKHGSSVDTADPHRQTPLFYAARHDHFATVDFLVEKGANLEQKDDQGFTPIFWAAHLSQKGARVDALSTHGRDVLHSATGPAVRAAIELGCDPELQDAQGRTRLFQDVPRGKFEKAKVLIEYGANIDKQDIYGQTCLFHAANQCNKEAVQCLMDAKLQAPVLKLLKAAEKKRQALEKKRERELQQAQRLLERHTQE
eukprot:g9344.t1